MSRYLLDTNMASHIMRGDIKAVRDRLDRVASDHLVSFSVISQAELYYGWAKRGHPAGLGKLIGSFLAGVEVLPWTESVARCYGDLRAECEAAGINLMTPDMMIAAQAKCAGAVLVTRDKAFRHLSQRLIIEDWTEAAPFAAR